MRTLVGNQAASYSGSLLQICTLVTITLQDLSSVYLTDLDIDYGKYKSAFGLDCSDVSSQIGGGGSTGTVTLLADKTANATNLSGSGGVTYQAVEAGLYDMAKVQIAWVDYGAADNIPLVLFTGYVTEINYGDATQLQLSLTTFLGIDHEICVDAMSQTCRADFGDAKCAPPGSGIDLAAMVDGPQVYGPGTDGQSFVMSRAEQTPPGYYNNGTCQFTSGANKGVGYEILSCSQPDANGRETIYVKVPLVADVVQGDNFLLYPGCDKMLNSGCTYWNNCINFQGEPFTATLAGDAPAAQTPAEAAASTVVSGTSISTGLPTQFNWILSQYAQTGFGVTLDLVSGTRYDTPNAGNNFTDYILAHDVYIAVYNALGGSTTVQACDGTLTPKDSTHAAALAGQNFSVSANWSVNPVSWTGPATDTTPAKTGSSAQVFYANIMLNPASYTSS